MDGLEIDQKQILGLPQKKQIAIILSNTEELKGLVRGYKLQQKLQWAAIVAVAVFAGVQKYIGGL